MFTASKQFPNKLKHYGHNNEYAKYFVYAHVCVCVYYVCVCVCVCVCVVVCMREFKFVVGH